MASVNRMQQRGPSTQRRNTMKKLALAAAIAAAFVSVASADDNVRARLAGFQEVPVVSTEGSGTFHAAISPKGDAIDYEITYTGMQGIVSQSHMHVGQRSVNGGIVLWICGNPAATPPTPGPAGTPVCTSPNGHFAGTWRPANVQTVANQQNTTGELATETDAFTSGVAYLI